MKLITFAVPCYNSAAYMQHCIDTLLEAGDEAEIILINDGSKDNTGEIADQNAAAHPEIIRVIHQENGGHGEGVNQGLRHATGLYYKVVDSDDWVDSDALKAIMDKVREFAAMEKPVDMLLANYVYEHTADKTQKVVNYTNVFPLNKVFTWRDTERFRPSQCILMHSVIYRTALLRDCGMELPKHTFYVDNIFVYQPLPFVKSMYYLNVDFYRYFIGREDQSVNEKVMISRVDQQLRVTELMLSYHNLRAITAENRRLGRYMTNYMAMMMAISSIFLNLSGKEEDIIKKKDLWSHLHNRNPKLYRLMKYRSVAVITNFPGYQGRRFSVKIYRLLKRWYKFN